MSNAALLLHPDAIATDGPRLLGRQAAGESFVRGFIRHADVDRFYFWQHPQATLDPLAAAVRALEPTTKPHRWFAPADRSLLSQVGVVSLPGPHIDQEAWARRPYGDHAYSLCGITHTTATARTMDNFANQLVAPVHDHDALICTSTAVRASVEAHLDAVREHLTSEYGPRRRPEAQRVTIPLGVNAADFETTPEDRRAWRERLDIPADAFVVLYVGRFHATEKMNPALMALALERAAQRLVQPIHWVNSGWLAEEPGVADFHGATRALCPSVRYHVVDGRPGDVRFSIWSVADAFISFSDNIQETFGLTPVEAMAAGLPCIVTDWDGYRDTVRHGEDGFRIDTVTPAAGQAFDFAYWHANAWSSFPDYVAAAAQVTMIDLGQATDAICALAESPELRRSRWARRPRRGRAACSTGRRSSPSTRPSGRNRTRDASLSRPRRR